MAHAMLSNFPFQSMAVAILYYLQDQFNPPDRIHAVADLRWLSSLYAHWLDVRLFVSIYISHTVAEVNSLYPG